MTESIRILGSRVDMVGMEDTLDFIASQIEMGTFARIVTLNAEIAYHAYENAEMREMINGADRVTPDGSGIIWAADKFGTPLHEKVSGIDLMRAVLKAAPAKGWKVFFFGGQEAYIQAAAENAKKQCEGLHLVGYRNGYFQEEDIPGIVQEIKASGADILFVGIGAPKQDFWLERYGKETGVKVGVGVGGSFDVLSGKVRRAPVFLQRAGMEWLWRLLREPWRYKRMLALPKYMRLVKKEMK